MYLWIDNIYLIKFSILFLFFIFFLIKQYIFTINISANQFNNRYRFFFVTGESMFVVTLNADETSVMLLKFRMDDYLFQIHAREKEGKRNILYYCILLNGKSIFLHVCENGSNTCAACER